MEMNSHYEQPTETSPSAPESLADYCARICAETVRECEARDNARRLRAVSYARAERSPAEIHCASSDRRDYPSDPATLVRVAETYESIKITRADIDAEKAIQAAIEIARNAAYSCPR